MTIRGSILYITKRNFLLIFFLWSGVMQMLAQVVIMPKSREICQGQPAIFSVSVTGSPSAYQWQEQKGSQWVNINGQEAQGNSYVAYNEGSYRCKVTIASVEHFSDAATLMVHKRPDIGRIDVPSVCEGGELRAKAVDVADNGRKIEKYQWILNGMSVDFGLVDNNIVPDHIRAANISESEWSLTLTVTNGCGSTTSAPVYLTIRQTPPLPVPFVKEYYCQGETIPPLTITGNNDVAVWYADAGGQTELSDPPVPVTDQTGSFSWWVMQKVSYPAENLTCKSGLAKATVVVRSQSAPPTTTADITLCLNDPAPNLLVQGVNIRWYNEAKEFLQTVPKINTSTTKPQIYYVTQTETGKCESSTESGKITIQIMDRSNVEDVKLDYDSELCPNHSTIVTASSLVSNPKFRWYANDNKTGLIQEGNTLVTPVLLNNAVYYITLQDQGKCESDFPKTVFIHVRDTLLPKITAPPNLLINTDLGVCYATNIQIGWPTVEDDCTTDVNKLVIYHYNTVVSYPIPPFTYAPGDTTIIWRVRDEAGNMDYALQNVSVKDREKPKGNCPVNIIREIDETESSAIINYDLIYNDNCTDQKDLKDSLVRGLPSGSEFLLGETRIIHHISDKVGNVDTCSFTVIVKHPDRELEVSLWTSANPICPGQELVLTSEVSGGSGRNIYSWKPRPWSEPVLKDYPLKTQTYTVTVSDGITFKSKDVVVEVRETQPVKLTLEGRRMDEIFEGDEVLVTATPGFDSYKLMLNNEIIQVAGMYNHLTFQAELGAFKVVVFATDENYCVTQDQMLIEVDSKKLPNVFTPNYDGKNDRFLEFLETPHAPEDFQLQVFTRAGNLLYQGNKGWNGIYKGKVMPQGTYLYIVHRKMNSGEYRTFKGNVTLKQ